MLGHSVAYFGIRVVNGLIGLAALYWLTRWLTPAQYGVYALGVAAVGVVASVGFQGLGVALGRFLTTHTSSTTLLRGEARRSFLWLCLATAVGAGAALLLRDRWGMSAGLVLTIACAAVLMGLHNLNLQVANVQGLPQRYGLLTATRAAFALLASAVFVHLGWGATGALLGLVVGCIVSLSLFGVERILGASLKGSATLRRELLRYAAPLTAVYATTMLLDVTDRFLIAWWLGTAQVAGYAAAFDLVQQSTGALLNVFFLAGLPRVLTAWESAGAEAARQALAPLANAVLLVGPAAAALFIAFAPEISQLMFGSALQPQAASVMPWMAATVSLLGFKCYVLDVALHVNKASHLQLLNTAAMAAVNIVLNLWLLPRWGIVGSAAAATVAVGIGVATTYWSAHRVGIYPPMGMNAIKGAFALLATVMVAWGLTDALHAMPPIARSLLKLVAAFGTFAAVAWLTNLGSLRGWQLWQRTAGRKRPHP
jgi:O-antigen/teichoic acid export membrane protein